MHWTRLCTMGVVVLAGGERAMGQAAHAVKLGDGAAALVRLENLRTGQVVAPGGAPELGGTPVFDTMTSEGSSAGLNVAYTDPASYRGESASTHAFAISMAERLAYRAPMDPAGGFPLPTDILWNDYVCDAARWPGGATQPLAGFGVIPYFQNTETPLRERTHTLVIRFFSEDLRTEHGAFSATYRVNPGQTGYFASEIDLREFEPAVLIPARGWVMLDWSEPGNSGVGCMFTGGDLVNPAYPRPEALWTYGSCDPETWWFADGVTGEGGPPSLVDPAWDGHPQTVSYLDVANTGALADWQFTGGGSPPVQTLAHDVAIRLEVGGAPACPCDINGHGGVESGDFFEFVIDFFDGNADFDNSGATDSQDFFQFLICFFDGC